MKSPSDSPANRQTRTYDRPESVVFLKTKDAFGGLSNMASGFPLSVNGIHIRTCEALYQACRFPHLPEVQELIIAQKSPMTAKMTPEPPNGLPGVPTAQVHHQIDGSATTTRIVPVEEFGAGD